MGERCSEIKSWHTHPPSVFLVSVFLGTSWSVFLGSWWPCFPFDVFLGSRILHVDFLVLKNLQKEFHKLVFRLRFQATIRESPTISGRMQIPRLLSEFHVEVEIRVTLFPEYAST